MVIVNANNKKTAQLLNDLINDANHVFILVYLNGCGPCNATRPEWKKMSDTLKKKYDENSDIAILDLDSEFMNDVEQIGNVNSFPTIKYLNPKNKIVEDYENSDISSKDRSSNSFITWIESKLSSNKNKNNTFNENVNDLLKKISKDDDNFSYDNSNINNNNLKSQKNKSNILKTLKKYKTNKKQIKKYKTNKKQIKKYKTNKKQTKKYKTKKYKIKNKK